MAFTLKDFENLKSFDFGYSLETSRREGEVKIQNTFQREKVLNNLFFVTMTEYHKNIPVSAIAFPPQVIEKSISEIISDSGLRQLHMAESEKEWFVTYYFDGMKEKTYPGEEVVIVPSPKVETYDKKPEMSLDKLVEEFSHKLREDKFHFIVINFANPDMVAHTGNIKATIKALEVVDFLYGALVWLLVRSGASALAATLSAGSLVLGVELLQAWLPGKAAEVTDPLLVVAAGGLTAVFDNPAPAPGVRRLRI